MTGTAMEWVAETPAHRQPLQLAIADLIELSERLATVEGFVPRKLLNRPPAVLATLLAGNELGLQPTVSLRTIFEIDGRVGMLAEIARALVYNAGHHLDVVTYEDAEVELRGRRADEHNWTSISWTWDRAKRAGLTGKQVWTRYPRQMLSARVTNELCRLKFPDVLAGLEVLADAEVTDVEVMSEEGVAKEPKPKTVTRRAAVKAPALDRPPAPAADTPLVPPAAEPIAGGAPEPPEEIPASPPPVVPDPEVDEMLGQVHDMREGLLPQWQRRLHARVAETFSGASPETRDAYRHAIVAVLTRGRDTGAVQSSSELTEAERMGFDGILNNIQAGACLIALLDSGVVEIRQGGWCYRVSFDPLEVRTIREAG